MSKEEESQAKMIRESQEADLEASVMQNIFQCLLCVAALYFYFSISTENGLTPGLFARLYFFFHTVFFFLLKCTDIPHLIRNMHAHYKLASHRD